MNNLSFVDLVVAGIVGSNQPSELSVKVVGAPSVQQRPKIVWKKRFIPTLYDPSAREKILFRFGLQRELVSCGHTAFPFFLNATNEITSKGLYLDVAFHVKRNEADYCMKRGKKVLKGVHQLYPRRKDVDNMLKFIMDAMHGVVYTDDKCVVRVSAMKLFLNEDEKDEYTTLRISIIN
jgi:hypothetical protein